MSNAKKIGLGIGLVIVGFFIISIVFSLAQETDTTKYDGLTPFQLSKVLKAEQECRSNPDCGINVNQMIEDFKKEEKQIHQGYSATAEQYEVNGNIISNVDVNAPLWNPREKSQEQIEERAIFLIDYFDIVRTESQQKRADEAREKYSDAIVINALVPSSVDIVTNTPEHFEKALKRNMDAGITVASATVFGFPGDGQLSPSERILANAKVMEKLDLETVIDTESIRQAKADGKMIVMFNTQGADYFINDQDMLEKLKIMRMHVSNFVYNTDNALAGGGNEQNMGVTELGKEFIQKSNELGVIVDCSHSSTQTCIDAAKYSQKPTIASHSNAYSVHPVTRNIHDEGLIAIGNAEGVVCSVGLGNYLNEQLDASPESMAIHIEYIGDLIGRDKTCFSTDYTHNYDLNYLTEFLPKVDVYPPENGWGAPTQNLAAEHVWGVVGVLEDEYDWSEEEIRGFLGENLMRVYDANWN